MQIFGDIQFTFNLILKLTSFLVKELYLDEKPTAIFGSKFFLCSYVKNNVLQLQYDFLFFFVRCQQLSRIIFWVNNAPGQFGKQIFYPYPDIEKFLG
jgi:hypothetical protein